MVEKTESTQQPHRASIIFSVSDRVGALDECLVILKELGISMTRIESRPSKDDSKAYDFFVDLSSQDDKHITSAVESLRSRVNSIRLIQTAADKGNARK